MQTTTAVDMKAAKMIGITIPPSILERARTLIGPSAVVSKDGKTLTGRLGSAAARASSAS